MSAGSSISGGLGYDVCRMLNIWGSWMWCLQDPQYLVVLDDMSSGSWISRVLERCLEHQWSLCKRVSSYYLIRYLVVGLYYGITIGIVSFATAMTVLTLNIHHKGVRGREVPEIIKKICFGFLAKLLCLNLHLPDSVDGMVSDIYLFTSLPAYWITTRFLFCLFCALFQAGYHSFQHIAIYLKSRSRENVNTR